MVGVSLAPAAANTSFLVDRENQFLFFALFSPGPSLPVLATLWTKNFQFSSNFIGTAVARLAAGGSSRRFENSDEPKVGTRYSM